VGVALAGALAVAALAGGALQEPPLPEEQTANASASLAVEAPTTLRRHLVFSGRVTVRARTPLENATLVLDRGWTERITISSIEPRPKSALRRAGRLALDYGRLARGDVLVADLQLQVGPSGVGVRRQGVVLADGRHPVASLARTVTVLP
jgi:hypothetical protein